MTLKCTAEKIREWMGQLIDHLDNKISITSIYASSKCTICNCSLADKHCLWTGPGLGIIAVTICDSCYHGDGPLTIPHGYCNCNYLNIWPDLCERYAACSRFDLRQGWYRNIANGKDLCIDHGNMLMGGTDLRLEELRSQFHLVGMQDLVRIELLPGKTVYMDKTGRGCAFNAQVLPVSPLPGITNDRYLEVAKMWFGIACNVPSEGASTSPSIDPDIDLDSPHRVSRLSSPWSSVVMVNGVNVYNDHGVRLVTDLTFNNICEWIPFDMVGDNGTSRNLAYGAYAIVNCNADSPYYEQVATIVFDNHYRASVDLTGKYFEEYLEEHTSYHNYNITKGEVHEDVHCEGCVMFPIRGPRWTCPEDCDYNLCDICNSNKHALIPGIENEDECNHCLVRQDAPEVEFIEYLRLNLNQGFHFG